MLVIGSQALSCHTIKLNRKPVDWDLICSRAEMYKVCDRLGESPVQTSDSKHKIISSEYGQIEFELTEDSPSGKIYHNLTHTTSLPFLFGYEDDFSIADPCVLFSIKKSHIHYPRFWSKHIRDYHLLKQIVHNDHLCAVTKIRRTETEIRLGKLKTPSLNKSKTDFFKDKVSNRTFIHDEIHLIMADYDKPMFEYIKIDQDKVACSKQKFFEELSSTERTMCVLEEAYVIALERCIIPMLYEGGEFTDPKVAFDWAVMRICTTLCSGWFRTFAVDDWPRVQFNYDPKYVNKFLTAVDSGKIKRIH